MSPFYRYNDQLVEVRRDLKSCKSKMESQSKQVQEYSSRLEEYDKKFEREFQKFQTLLTVSVHLKQVFGEERIQRGVLFFRN